MKVIIISILLFFTANAQNSWYVSRDATGANTGRDWTDAWNYFDSSAWAGYNGINWAIVSAGDTIWVDGGSDSTAYYPFGASIATWIRPPAIYDFDPPVVIRPSFEDGKNGEVYITSREPDYYSNFFVDDISGITIQKFNFVERHPRTNANASISLRTERITLDSCYFLNIGESAMLGMGGGEHTLKNSVMDYVESDSAAGVEFYSFGVPEDTVLYNGGGHLVDNNIFILRNHSIGSGEHKDMAQMSGDGNYFFYTTSVVSNNLFIDLDNVGDDWNAALYMVDQRNMRFLFYNNIIVAGNSNTSTMAGAWWNGYNNKATIQSGYVFNNTFILKSDAGGCGALIANIDTVIGYNNLFVLDTIPQGYILADVATTVMDFDYNVYAGYDYSDGDAWWFNGVYRNWAYWTGTLGFDTNGDTTDSRMVDFVSKYDTIKASYLTTVGRDAGVDLSTIFSEFTDAYPNLMYDALGNPRGSGGAWDIGALEYQGGSTNSVNVKTKIFLQGPFYTNTSSMLTTLNQSNLLPNSQPYNSPPWNYSGNENLGSGPNSTMVDWVLVELRSASNPLQVVARRAAVLKNDGHLLNTNGSEGISFNNVDPGSYYIAIFHRDHLAIMSAAPVPLSSNSALYDFTTGMNKAYGQNPMVELLPGKFGMFAADGNADGVVNTADRDDVWLIQNGNMGYLQGDFNMNTGVTVHDVNQFWNLNNGAVTQVP